MFVFRDLGMKRLQLTCVSLLLLLLLLDIIPDTQSSKVQYQYKKYTYRKKRDVSLPFETFELCRENQRKFVFRHLNQLKRLKPVSLATVARGFKPVSLATVARALEVSNQLA